ncbi:unnamed protein product [Diplocarpon coronariae]
MLRGRRGLWTRGMILRARSLAEMSRRPKSRITGDEDANAWAPANSDDSPRLTPGVGGQEQSLLLGGERATRTLGAELVSRRMVTEPQPRRPFPREQAWQGLEAGTNSTLAAPAQVPGSMLARRDRGECDIRADLAAAAESPRRSRDVRRAHADHPLARWQPSQAGSWDHDPASGRGHSNPSLGSRGWAGMCTVRPPPGHRGRGPRQRLRIRSCASARSPSKPKDPRAKREPDPSPEPPRRHGPLPSSPAS